MKTKILTLLLAVVASIGTMFAWDYERVQIGDLYYNLNATNKTAEVTSQISGSPYWTTTITTANIPTSVTYNSATYSVTSIGVYAFYKCTGLTSVTIPNSVTSIGNWAFAYCSGVTSPIYNAHVFAFMPKSYSGAYTIPDGIESIAGGAFDGCSGLTSVTIPNSVTSIGGDAFLGCSGVTSVTWNAKNCSSGGFGSQVTSFVFGNEVESIPGGCCRYMSKLTSVTIPNSVTSIGDWAFYGCSRLTSVTIEAETPPTLGSRAFDYTNDCPIYVPCGTIDAYKAAWPSALRITHSPSSACIYSISTSSSNPVWGTTAGDKSVLYLENVVISATANYGYHFVKWNDNNTENPRTISAVKDVTYTATFAKNTYTITQNTNSTQGSILGVTQAEYLDNITLTVNPNYGYHFTQWNDGNTDNPRTFVLTRDTTFTAEFAIDKSGTCGKNNLLQWTFADDGTLTISGNGELTENYTFGLEAPTQMQQLVIGNEVTSIGERAFPNCSGLTSVTIGNSVTSIGESAFSGCSGLTSVTIGNSVTSIGESAFSGCSGLTSVTIPNSVTSIGESAFSGCSGLTGKLIIPNSVRSIGSSAFQNCSSLTGELIIPNSVTSIGSSAFYGCSGLTGELIIPNGVANIGDNAFYGCKSLASVTIGYSVTSIGENAFYGCRIGTINFIGSTKNWCNKKWSPASISNNLKYKLKINGVLQENVVIPNSVTSIGSAAFAYCSSLTSVTIPNSVTSIGSSAFQNCSSLTSVTLNSNAIVSKNYSGNSNLKTIFGGQVTEYILGESVTSIGNAAFYGCSGLTSVKIGNSVKSIVNYAFYDCSSLSSVTIPNSMTSIGDYAFNRCSSLTSITIPNSITSIGMFAFQNCSGLTSVTIGNSVTSIGNYAFRNCSNITIVVWNAKNGPSYNFGSQVTSFTFGNEVEIIPAELCKGMTNLTSVIWNAKNCSNSGNFGKQVENFVLGDSVEVIPDDLCKDMSKLSKIEIPKSVVRIGNNAFKDCGNDGNLVLPASLKTIGDYAFKGWTKTKKIDIPNNVTKIGAHAFDSCYLATSVYLGSSVEEIGDYAFKGCVRVNEITSMNTNAPIAFENTLTSISANAYLYVPAGSKHAYQIDPYWSRFNVYEIAAEESSLTKDAVTVVANEDNAIFTWPTKTEAASYSLQISKDGEVFCTLVFNSNGQLTGIAFAPGRNGAAHAPAATMSVAGMSFTVTGLNVASKYAYRLAVTNDASEELVAYSGEFATTGYDGEVNPGGNPEGIEDVFTDEHKASKILRNGTIFILRNGKTYTMQGQEVK